MQSRSHKAAGVGVARETEVSKSGNDASPDKNNESATAPSKTESALHFASIDWHANVGEHDRKVGSGLDEIFKTSGWSKYGVRKGRWDKIPDWCGFAVGTWLVRTGMNAQFRVSFFHVFNIEAFFTYGTKKNVNPKRLMTRVKISGAVQPIRAWHEANGATRKWVDLRKDKTFIDFRPNDIVLFDWSRIGDADHVGLVRSFDGRVLEVLEGNRTGVGPDEKVRKDAVVLCRYDLTVASDRKLLYGLGRMSDLDFTSHEVS